MEFTVPPREGFLVAGRRLGVSQDDLHVVQIGPRGVQHREPRGEGLNGEARLNKLQGTNLIGKVDAAMVGLRRRADKGAAAKTPRHQAGFFQLVQRAAHGAPRGLKCRCQLPLRRKAVAFAVGPGLDSALQISGDGAHAPAWLLQLVEPVSPVSGQGPNSFAL